MRMRVRVRVHVPVCVCTYILCARTWMSVYRRMYIDSPVHSGSSFCQSPSSPQTLVRLPASSLKPGRHEYVAVSFTLTPLVVNDVLAMSLGC